MHTFQIMSFSFSFLKKWRISADIGGAFLPVSKGLVIVIFPPRLGVVLAAGAGVTTAAFRVVCAAGRVRAGGRPVGWAPVLSSTMSSLPLLLLITSVSINSELSAVSQYHTGQHRFRLVLVVAGAGGRLARMGWEGSLVVVVSGGAGETTVWTVLRRRPR